MSLEMKVGLSGVFGNQKPSSRPSQFSLQFFFSKDELVLELSTFVWRHCHSDFPQPKGVPLCLFCSCAPVQRTREREFYHQGVSITPCLYSEPVCVKPASTLAVI